MALHILGTVITTCSDIGTKTIKMRCSSGRINVSLFRFGRWSISVCSNIGEPPGSSSSLCSGYDLVATVGSWCNFKSSCEFDVYPGKFNDDPCVGIFKYLEWSYECSLSLPPPSPPLFSPQIIANFY